MAWDVNTIYGFQRFLVRKNQSGNISATDFFYVWNSEQVSMHADLVGKWQVAATGRLGVGSQGFVENELITTRMAPFIKKITLPISSGNAIKPTGFVYTLALRINNTKVFQVNHDQIWAVQQDVIDPPSITENSYYYTEYENYYSFLPATVSSVDLDYIISPTDVVWAFTLDGNNRQVYDVTNSVQPMWGQSSIIEITKRSLKQLGISFKEADFVQYGESIINKGD